MKKTMRLSVLAMGVAVAGAHGYSNPIEGGSTEFVTDQWNVAMPWLMVGGNSSSNTMFVWNGGRVESQIGYIGNNASSVGNKAFVSGSNAVWNSSMEIAVGNQGSDNLLAVFSGGRVDTANAYVGKASGNNYAMVSGAGSELNATTLHVGHTGSENTLSISDGGRVSSIDGSIGYWIGADDNSAFVMGTNAVWNNTGTLNVGERGSGNYLYIVDGGTAQSPVVNLGVQSYSSNNAISIRGEGALLDAPELNIGGSAAGAGGTGNRVSVRDGGTVATTDLNIYAGNQFDLNDGGRLAVSTNFNAAMSGFNFNAGSTLEVGGELTGMGSTIEDQRTVVMNGSKALWNKSGSSLYVGRNTYGNSMVATNGALIKSYRGYVGYGSNSSNNIARVSGRNSMWKASGRITVGSQGDDNHLVIEKGGEVIAQDFEVGFSSQASGNTVAVSGEGSKLTTTGGGGVVVGVGGDNNRIEVTDGAQVNVPSGVGYAILGYYAGANNNSMLVDDATVELTQNMYVGLYGSDNHLAITNGGVVRSTAGGTAIGRHTTSDGNSAIVTGTGSLLDSTTSLSVGGGGSNNRLFIEDGGRVADRTGYIGYASGANNNAALVTGKGSVWQNNEGLYIGSHKSGNNWVDGGTGNSLTIEDGGWVVVGDSTNFPLWGSGILVGSEGGLAEMGVGNGSQVESGNLIIGMESSQLGSVVVKDAGTIWNQNGQVIVGEQGSGNELTIDDGAHFSSIGGVIGREVGAEHNRVMVRGSNSVWSTRFPPQAVRRIMASPVDPSIQFPINSFPEIYVTPGSVIMDIEGLVIGEKGSDNRLDILDGGVVKSGMSWIGMKPGADSNSVVVAGSGSQWQARSLTLGGAVGFVGPQDLNGTDWFAGGTGNSLTVSNGGWVQVGGVSTNNIPEQGTLGVVSVGGLNGAEMIVANGSRVDSDIGYVGIDPTMNGSVTVIGTGSVWSNSTRLYVGYDGSGNTMRIEGGAKVVNYDGTIGYGISAAGNRVVVSGQGSLWDNTVYSLTSYTNSSPPIPGYDLIYNDPVTGSDSLSIGYLGSSNSLVITDGGRVESSAGYIGYGEIAEGNSAVISGRGSVWDNSGQLHIGYEGSGNTLRIEDGGKVYAMNSTIGYGEAADGNRVVVTGEDSVWGHGRTVPREGVVAFPIYEWPTRTNWPPEVISPPDGWPMFTNYPPIDWPGLTNFVPVNPGGVSDLWVGSSNVTIQVETFASGAGGVVVLVSNETSVVTNSTPPPTMIALRAYASIGDLAVGRSGSGNTLHIEDGGLVANYHGIVGETSNAWNNTVSVSGVGSEWRNSGDLYIGGRMSQVSYLIHDQWFTPWVDGGQGNSLYVGDGGLVSVGRDMHNRNYSTVNIETGGHISISSNYYQDATSVLRFGVETNAAGAPLSPFVSVGGTAEFEEGATLQYHSNVGLLDFDTFYTNLIVEADTLIVGGVTNANALDLEAINLDGSLVDLLLWESSQNIYGLVGRKYLADSAGFVEGTMMAVLSKEIDDLSLLGDSGASALINLLNGMSSAQQNAQLTQQYERSTPNYAHIQGMTEGMGEIKKHITRHQPAVVPEGPAGPHRPDQGWQGWVKPYGSWADYSAQGAFSGYDHNIHGTLVGADRIEGDALIGVAGGYARSNISQDDGDASEAKTGYGVLYASWGTEDWFVDVNMAYGLSSVEDRSGTALGNTADYDARNYAAYFGGGKEMKLNDGRILFTPQASLLMSYYYQEGYSDQSGLLPREVDAYDRDSILSSLGATLAIQKEYDIAVVKPEARLYWLHEFNTDVDSLDYTVSSGGGQYHFFMPTPIENILEAGLGISCRFNDELDLVFDIDGRFGEDYSAYAISGRAVFEF